MQGMEQRLAALPPATGQSARLIERRQAEMRITSGEEEVREGTLALVVTHTHFVTNALSPSFSLSMAWRCGDARHIRRSRPTFARTPYVQPPGLCSSCLAAILRLSLSTTIGYTASANNRNAWPLRRKSDHLAAPSNAACRGD